MGDSGETRADLWNSLLTGENRDLRPWRRLWQRVPPRRGASPRRPLPRPGPHRGTGSRVRADDRQHLLCRKCFGTPSQNPGGAEVEISITFADVYGSTGIAERVSPAEFGGLLQEHYGLAAAAAAAA